MHRRSISREHSVTHQEDEWEAMRELFHNCYVDMNMSLKAATVYMKEHYDFSATERQWERKKEQWGFSKYEKREARQSFIDRSLAAGMTVEDILNAPDFPVDESRKSARGGKGERRDWRRFVRREQASRSRSRSPQPPRSSMDQPMESVERDDRHDASNNLMVERTYDVGLPNNMSIFQDQSPGAFPDTIMLEATPHKESSQNPVQLHVVTEANPPANTFAAPEISISIWDDTSARLQSHGPSYASFVPDFPDSPISNVPHSNVNSSTDVALERSYEAYTSYSAQPTAQMPEMSTTYSTQDTGNWPEAPEPDTTYNAAPQDFFTDPGDVSDIVEAFPRMGDIPQVQFDQAYSGEPSFETSAPQITSANTNATDEYTFADPFAADLSEVVKAYTSGVQSAVKDFLAGLYPISSKVTLEKLEESLQSRRNICLQTMSMAIENQARARQRTIESTVEKCRALEQIMAEKGIDTRAELRARNRRQPIENGALDMSQLRIYEATSGFQF